MTRSESPYEVCASCGFPILFPWHSQKIGLYHYHDRCVERRIR